MYDVTSIQNLKKDVLYFVAKASFEGTLEEERDLIPEKMIERTRTNIPLLHLQRKRNRKTENSFSRR